MILLLILLIISLSGCTNQNPISACTQVITPAISPNGECTEFPTPCDVPKGFTLVDSCEEEPMDEPVILDEPITPEEPPLIVGGDKDEYGCIGSAGYSWCEAKQKCLRVWEEPCEEIPEVTGKFNFDSELVFCEFNGLMKKYTMFYRIRNTTKNIPTYQSKIWLKVPDLNNYGQVKTIQKEYVQNQVIWEEQQFTYLGYGALRGQYWEIRNQDIPSTVDFQLIYCEPEFAAKDDCTPSTGTIVFEGNTGELC